MSTITFSLISHTNVGKTSLARTLLRREIGEVSDQAHVTDKNEVHPLIETAAHSLVLWDTPGFGDSARLLKRLRGQGSPLAWLQSQLWDRIVDRPLYCSQQAVINVREEADLVLYLVSAAESPEDAGYVPLEMELLSWTEVPVVILLNQTGENAGEDLEPIARAWRTASRAWPAVRAVLPLDAHRRSWVEEGVLLEESAAWIDPRHTDALTELTAAWHARGRSIVDRSVASLATFLSELLHHRESFEGSTFSPGAKRAAQEKIITVVEKRTRALLAEWIAIHELTGALAEEVESDWGEFVDSGEVWLDGKKLGLGGALGGAATGALVDAKTLGLTMGAGTMIGGILGGIAGWGLGGWISEKSTKGRHLRIGGDAIEALLERLLVGLCVITHHGRGRGEVRPEGWAARWIEQVDGALAPQLSTLSQIWGEGKQRDGDPQRTAKELEGPLNRVALDLLAADGERIAETVARIEKARATAGRVTP